MKCNISKKKNLFITLGFTILTLAILCSVWIGSKEPVTDFTPMPEETKATTDTWEEEFTYPEILIADASSDTAVIDNAVDYSTSTKAPSDNPDTVIISPAKTESLSASITKDAADSAAPEVKPITKDPLTDPDVQPEYDNSVPIHTEIKDFKEPENHTAAAVTSSGQVFDPIFGWIQTGNTNQNTVDSSGDINKQIGMMGNAE